jgi:hypothetical protein
MSVRVWFSATSVSEICMSLIVLSTNHFRECHKMFVNREKPQHRQVKHTQSLTDHPTTSGCPPGGQF